MVERRTNKKGRMGVGFTKKKSVGEMKNRVNSTEGGRNGMAEASEGAARDNQGLEAICLGEGRQEQQVDKTGGCEVTTEENVEKGMVESIGRSHKGVLADVGKENWENGKRSGGKEASQHGRTETPAESIPKFEFGQG